MRRTVTIAQSPCDARSICLLAYMRSRRILVAACKLFVQSYRFPDGAAPLGPGRQTDFWESALPERATGPSRFFLGKNWGRCDERTGPFTLAANDSRTGTAGDDIGIQRDCTIPRQRPAFQIHAGSYCD